MLWSNGLGWVHCASVKVEESRKFVWGRLVAAWSGDVKMHCVISFFCNESLFLNCCDLMLLLLVLEFMHVAMCIDLQIFLSWMILMTVQNQHENVDRSATMVFQVVVPSVELEKLAYREESVATAWM